MKHVLAVLCASLSVAFMAISPAFAGVPIEPTKTEKVVVKKTTTTTCTTKKKCCPRYVDVYIDRPFVIGKKQVYQHDYNFYPYSAYYMPDEKAYPGPAVYNYRRPYFYNHRPYLGYIPYHGWKPYYGRTYVSENYRGNLYGSFVYRGGTVRKVVED
ncbi:MAG: hypothetical protein ACAI35_13410 [Candidatus Methylacidiphilales bacterium]|nr:hypothetical protein [Candidatus Methylacidiphilales bacterium]